ncbi:MAG: lipase chaperone LimK [Oceanicoccus sp.]|jgi:lipase chaperone LimK
MKFVFGISAVFLLALVYVFNNSASIYSSNEIVTDNNPLRGAQIILADLKNQNLDFSLLQSPYSNDSIDTQIAGLIRIDNNGMLIVDTELKAFMDYFLSSVGQVTPEQALQRLRLHFYQDLPESAADEAMEILKNYLAFKEASFDELARPIDSERSEYDANYRYTVLEDGLQTLYDLRRTHLGNDAAQALFVDDEAYAQYTLTNMKADLDESLSIAERQQLKDLAKSQLPEEMASILKQQEDQAKAIQAYTSLLDQNPSVEQLREFAFNTFDSEQAQSIVSDYESQMVIKQKYNHFNEEQQRIINQGLDTETQQQAIQDIALEIFTADEYSMVQAWQMAEQP